MKKRWFLLLALAVVAAGAAVVWLFLSGRVAYLALGRRLRVEVNGMPVKGEVFQNRFTAIVTRRDAGREHSYQLFFAGDTDMAGDMGSVVDCHEWVAPALPVLLETRDYPPCKHLPEDGPLFQGWPLLQRGNSMQFVTKDHATISVVKNR